MIFLWFSENHKQHTEDEILKYQSTELLSTIWKKKNYKMQLLNVQRIFFCFFKLWSIFITSSNKSQSVLILS